MIPVLVSLYNLKPYCPNFSQKHSLSGQNSIKKYKRESITERKKERKKERMFFLQKMKRDG